MDTTCLGAALLPHPPIMLPEIGRQELKKIEATVTAVSTAASLLVERHPETLVVITPHNYVFSDSAAIFPVARIHGDLGKFGFPDLTMSVNTDMELAEEIIRQADGHTPLYRIDEEWAEKYGHAIFLDQGAFVPLYYMRKAGFDGPVVLLSPRFDEYESMMELGRLIVQAAAVTGRRIAIIASGDLSHRLLPGSPNGYSPSGAIFDKTVMEGLKKQDLSGIRAMSSQLIEEAGMCGLPSVYFLFGALRCMHPSMPVFSYEGPFGVGYGVALYLNESNGAQVTDRAVPDIRVRLARESIAYYLEHHTVMSVPKDLPDDLTDRAGAFVSLHKGSMLRGCIGTFLPMQMNIASEIIHNAVSAATRDPRFYPVRPEELNELSISVDVLGTPEAVTSPDKLDPKKYGVIVMSHARTGLLLPDLPGVDTVQQQIDIAKEKAGIPPQVHPDLYRFTVTRYK